MYANKPLFWHQGLFLQPQHFQLADLHQLYRLRALREFGQPYFWGLTKLDVREGALERNLEVTGVEVLFEDGNFVSFPGNAMLEQRSFDKAWQDGEKLFMVYLGLKKWNSEGGNVTLTDDNTTISNTMFAVSPDPGELPDLLGNGPVGQIKPMHYVLRLFWETELDDIGAYTIIPLGRLMLDLEQARLDESFIPPALTLDSSEYLTNVFKDISDQVALCSRRLEQYKSPGGLGTGDLNFTSTVFLLALRTLNRYAPVLKHFVEAPHVHPWKAFGLLRQIIGELSSFSRDIISRILDSLTAGPEFMSQFTFEDPYFTAELPDRAFGTGNTFWLLVRTHEPEKAMPELLKIAKLSATKGMSTLLSRAINGISITPVENPPPGLPRTKGALCFHIDTESSLWNEVQRSGSLSLYWDSAPREMMAYIAAMKG
ncbi:type VI secretion system baseplate subunit TssK [Desulfovibrio sp. UCD-KL4C]|uniref:type VI secretion system baseplate subunit TssK n=1 Tax=Desulfovibrio sp. UCD-KL4C TaxID=2578120 RepID=UPI0025BAD946|nr:type VI secretion system baseplate subunit TssK [Desulfovibrio sp. UCD-KL4C]